MKIDTVIINNFRCFSHLEVTFHPHMTVLIAPNGTGKTTILDAVRIALWPFVKGFDLGSQAGKSATIQIDDVRLRRIKNTMEPVLPSTVTALTRDFFGHGTHQWCQYREQIKPRTQMKGDKETNRLTQYAKKLQAAVYEDAAAGQDAVTLPLMVYLGTGRLWYQGRYGSEAEDKQLDNSVYSRFWGYQNCLTAISGYKQFETWFSWVFRSFRELQIAGLESPLNEEERSALENFSAAIDVVQKAVNALTREQTGWFDLQYRASAGQQLVMEHEEQGYIPLDMLSDGLRNMVAMVSDIAFRCIKLNPHLGKYAAEKTTGIVLIDEVDMFLHPSWQQRVLPSLADAFPELQFIVTTHSPQVISAVHSDSVRSIGENTSGEIIAGKPLANTYGVPSHQVMHSVMLVDPQPPVKEKNDLLRLTELVDQGMSNTPEAIELMEKLTTKLGEPHPQLQRLQRSIIRQRNLAKGNQQQ